MHSRAARSAFATSAPTSGASSAGELLDALDALGLRAELLVEHDVLELRQPVFEPRLQVRLVEELRIRQPRADDALVAGDDGLAAVLGLDVGDEQELVDELGMRGVAHDEAFLVVADGGADHFFRDVQELFVERAHQHHRPFDEARDFVEQALVLDQFEALRESELLGFGEDDALAPLGVEHDLGLVELGLIIVEPAHRERLRRQEAVAARLVAGGDAVDRERHDVRLLGLRPERGDDGMQRPHPGERARLARRLAPAHRFRPRKALDHLGQDFADHVDRGAARLLDHRDIEVALLVRLHLGFARSISARRL